MLRDEREDSFCFKATILSSKASIEPSQEPLPIVFLVGTVSEEVLSSCLEEAKSWCTLNNACQ